jgi:hypothetical protein
VFADGTPSEYWLVLWISSAKPAFDGVDAAFTTTMSGSYDSAAWRQSLRDQLVAAGVQPIPAGPVRLTAAITTGRAACARS